MGLGDMPGCGISFNVRGAGRAWTTRLTMTQTITHTVLFMPGLPEADGPYLFLMRNGSVVERVLHRDFNH